jgi:hypothetical protein
MDMDVKQLPPPQVETTQAFLLGSNCPAIPPVGVLLVPFLWAIRGTQFWAKAFPRFVTHQFKENGNAQYNQLGGTHTVGACPSLSGSNNSGFLLPNGDQQHGYQPRPELIPIRSAGLQEGGGRKLTRRHWS